VELCYENLNFIKIGQKYRALYAKSEVHFIIAGDVIQAVSSARISGCYDRQGNSKNITQMFSK
jgi:hypothetical protein